MLIECDIIQSAGIGIIALLLGMSPLRSVMDGEKPLLDMERVIIIGNICLSLFLGMAMVSLKLWELISLALPLLAILLTQVLLLTLYARYFAFYVLGRSYDAAVLVSGLCGFGLGATPNAMANMSAVCAKYRYTALPFLIVPIIGGIFNDVINTSIISAFLT